MPPKKPKAKARPRTMADIISLAPSASIEYVLFRGLGAALTDADITSRIEVLERDKRAHSSSYKRITLAYLREELVRRNESKPLRSDSVA